MRTSRLDDACCTLWRWNVFFPAKELLNARTKRTQLVLDLGTVDRARRGLKTDTSIRPFTASQCALNTWDRTRIHGYLTKWLCSQLVSRGAEVSPLHTGDKSCPFEGRRAKKHTFLDPCDQWEFLFLNAAGDPHGSALRTLSYSNSFSYFTEQQYYCVLTLAGRMHIGALCAGTIITYCPWPVVFMTPVTAVLRHQYSQL